MNAVWDGITRLDSLTEPAAKVRSALADAARDFRWPQVLQLIKQHKDFVNACRPGGKSLNAPLHRAAQGGAPVEVVQQLIAMGAWRTLRNALDERPLDLATQRGHVSLLKILEPAYKHRVPLELLAKIQANFHDVIREREGELVTQHALRLPELEPLLELDPSETWFPVPGMYGGFKYHLDLTGVEPKLVSESWSRVSEGSGQRHEITVAGSRLVEEGFV